MVTKYGFCVLRLFVAWCFLTVDVCVEFSELGEFTALRIRLEIQYWVLTHEILL